MSTDFDSSSLVELRNCSSVNRVGNEFDPVTKMIAITTRNFIFYGNFSLFVGNLEGKSITPLLFVAPLKLEHNRQCLKSFWVNVQ